MQITREFLDAIWPRASATLKNTIVEQSPEFMVKYKIDTPRRLKHFFGQYSYETLYGQKLVERFNYSSAAKLMAVFGKGKSSAALTQAEANKLMKITPLSAREKATAMRVYGGKSSALGRKLGNTTDLQGWLMCGRGLPHLTGWYNYLKAEEITGLPLTTNPEMASDPKHAFLVGCVYWFKRGMYLAADTDKVEKVTLLLNGGTNGLADRKTYTALIGKQVDKFAKVMFAKTPAPAVAYMSFSAPPEEEVQLIQDVPLEAVLEPSWEPERETTLVIDTPEELYVDAPGEPPAMISKTGVPTAVSGSDLLGETGDSNNSYVLAVQRKLAELNYAPGVADGAYGSLTRDAINAFCADNSIQILDNGETLTRDMYKQIMTSTTLRPLSDARVNATLSSNVIKDNAIIRFGKKVAKYVTGLTTALFGVNLTTGEMTGLPDSSTLSWVGRWTNAILTSKLTVFVLFMVIIGIAGMFMYYRLKDFKEGKDLGR